jgi:multidrug efflux system membrane fusion protein
LPSGEARIGELANNGIPGVIWKSDNQMANRIAVLPLVLALLLHGCSAKPKPRSGRVPVRVAVAAEMPMPFQLTSVGTVEAIQSANVAAQVGGVITRVAFREGDHVRAGQVLFRLDARPFRAALDQAVAVLERDRARAATARAEAQRSQRLYEENVLSQAEWDQRRTEAEALAATVRADEASVRTARLNLEFASIRAPISGQTGRLLAREGDYVRAGANETLVTIIQPRPIRVRFTVPDRDVPQVLRYRAENPRVLVQPAGGGAAPSEGKLVFVDQSVDASTGTLLLKGEFANADGRLVPGQFVDVRLVLFVAPRALVIPSAAVSTGQEGPYVYLVRPDSTVVPRPVAIERTQDDAAIVASGLSAGDRVVTDGQLRLSPGAKVQIRAAGAAVPGAAAAAAGAPGVAPAASRGVNRGAAGAPGSGAGAGAGTP